MPYDEVGGGGGGGGFSGGGFSGGGYRSGGGNYCTPLRCCYTILACILVAGIICISWSVKFLAAGFADSRGKEIGQWDNAIKYWNDGGLAEFEGLGLNLGDNRTGMMTYSNGTITPKDFGESSWSTNKIKPPSEVTSALYSASLCPHAAPNELCNFGIYDSSGNTVVHRSLTPNAHTQRRIQSSFCR